MRGHKRLRSIVNHFVIDSAEMISPAATRPKPSSNTLDINEIIITQSTSLFKSTSIETVEEPFTYDTTCTENEG